MLSYKRYFLPITVKIVSISSCMLNLFIICLLIQKPWNITRKLLTLYKKYGIINYLICVRTNQSMVTGAENMIKNNIEVDVKVKCIENGLTQAQLAEEIGTTGQYVNRIIKKQDGVVNKTFVQMMETLGYDIELTYVKKYV